jgi:ribosomal protein L29
MSTIKLKDLKQQLAGLTAAELNTKARELSSLIAKNKLELAAGRIADKRLVFNQRKQLAFIKTKMYESLSR